MQGEKDLAFIRKVTAYIATQEFAAIHIEQIDSECVMVLDTMQECDVYFSPERYEIIMPQIWAGGRTLFPGRSREFGLGILPGVGKFPPIKGLAEAREYASRHLRLKTRALP